MGQAGLCFPECCVVPVAVACGDWVEWWVAVAKWGIRHNQQGCKSTPLSSCRPHRGREGRQGLCGAAHPGAVQRWVAPSVQRSTAAQAASPPIVRVLCAPPKLFLRRDRLPAVGHLQLHTQSPLSPAKFLFFVMKVGRADTLFEASFSPLASSGKPLSKCGKCKWVYCAVYKTEALCLWPCLCLLWRAVHHALVCLALAESSHHG